MGSSFSIVNNTNKPIWVKVGVCQGALWGSIGGVLAVITLGAAAVVFAAGGAVAVAATAAGIAQGVGSTLGSLTVSDILAGLAGVEAANSLRQSLKKESSVRINPGGKYTKHGSLSLVLSVKVLYDDGRRVTRDCFTGPTDGSEKVYYVTEHF